MKEIELSRGLVGLVDDDDFDQASRWKWSATPTSHGGFYVTRNIRTTTTACGRTRVYLHRVLMSAGPGQQVDHINGDGLDNRRSNMRFATYAENGHNRRLIGTDNTSGFKGVSQAGRQWRAQIKVHGRKIALGTFASAVEAAHAYDAAALAHFGEFARPNFEESR